MPGALQMAQRITYFLFQLSTFQNDSNLEFGVLVLGILMFFTSIPLPESRAARATPPSPSGRGAKSDLNTLVCSQEIELYHSYSYITQASK